MTKFVKFAVSFVLTSIIAFVAISLASPPQRATATTWQWTGNGCPDVVVGAVSTWEGVKVVEVQVQPASWSWYDTDATSVQFSGRIHFAGDPGGKPDWWESNVGDTFYRPENCWPTPAPEPQPEPTQVAPTPVDPQPEPTAEVTPEVTPEATAVATQEPDKGWRRDWWACDDPQMPEGWWEERCAPEIPVVPQTAVPCEETGCVGDARFEELDNTIVFGGLADGDNRGTWYSRDGSLPPAEDYESPMFNENGLVVRRWEGQLVGSTAQEWPCSAEPQFEQFRLENGVLYYRVLPQNTINDLQVVFTYVPDATLDDQAMTEVWNEFKSESDANFNVNNNGFRRIGNYEVASERDIVLMLQRTLGVRKESQLAHDVLQLVETAPAVIADAAMRFRDLMVFSPVNGSEHNVSREVNIRMDEKLPETAAIARQIAGVPQSTHSAQVVQAEPVESSMDLRVGLLGLPLLVVGFAVWRRR